MLALLLFGNSMYENLPRLEVLLKTHVHMYRINPNTSDGPALLDTLELVVTR